MAGADDTVPVATARAADTGLVVSSPEPRVPCCSIPSERMTHLMSSTWYDLDGTAQTLTPQHRRYHAILDRGDPPVCRYCGVPLACGCDHAAWNPTSDGCMTTVDGVEQATVDHVIPRARGGSHDLSNLVAACADCNSRKGAR